MSSPSCMLMSNNELPLKRFSSQAMLSNIGSVKSIIQRIRQQEGGVGSLEDELSLHRMIQDLDLLVDMVDGVRANYDELHGKLDTITASAMALQTQNQALKETYEKMIQERNDKIKELERQLGLRPKDIE